ncbi:MAG: Diadenylate cyclase [Ignavibacteria bacterium]|nr:Diadenylate cyclase [Ignavibacteria bacterium]
MSVTFIDVLDITLVAILFFWLYRAMKDTIAVQILFGLVILIGLSFITETVGLRSINWIMKIISDIWLLAFIILFQPELRKLLLLITRSRLFRLFIRSKISETLDEVVEAVADMSDKHTGALIVFTRSQNVKMTLDTGIPIRAVVSKELLVSIFNTKSPLHDGAVIIDNQMINAARCILPLSLNTKFKGKNLGTRHRAALGLSEQVDAVVLVVSEETGSISIAESGEFTLNIQREHLLAVLNSRLSDTG